MNWKAHAKRLRAGLNHLEQQDRVELQKLATERDEARAALAAAEAREKEMRKVLREGIQLSDNGTTTERYAWRARARALLKDGP